LNDFGLFHFKLTSRLALNLTGIRQPRLFQLQTTPFRHGFIMPVFQGTQLDSELTTQVTGVDHTQGATDIEYQYRNQDQ